MTAMTDGCCHIRKEVGTRKVTFVSIELVLMFSCFLFAMFSGTVVSMTESGTSSVADTSTWFPVGDEDESYVGKCSLSVSCEKRAMQWQCKGGGRAVLKVGRMGLRRIFPDKVCYPSHFPLSPNLPQLEKYTGDMLKQ